MKTWQLSWPAVVSWTIVLGCDAVRWTSEPDVDTATPDDPSVTSSTNTTGCISIEGDGGSGPLFEACAEGLLVTLPLPEGAPTRELRLDDDLRDVVVQGDELLVSRFRSAELLRVNAQGTIVARTKPSSLEAQIPGNCIPEALSRVTAGTHSRTI